MAKAGSSQPLTVLESQPKGLYCTQKVLGRESDSSRQCLLRTFQVPGTLLGPRVSTMMKMWS